MFEAIGTLNLPSGSHVIDIGSQDICIGSAPDLDRLNRFITAHGGIGFETDPLPSKLEAKDVYARSGYSYLRIDVDGRPDTAYVDLAKLMFPLDLKSSADIVVNAGTTEHLANPIGAFALMHFLVKPGGVLFHDVPLFGFGNHGLNNPTPKFWHALIWMNSYELICSRLCKIAEASCDPGNFYHAYLSYMEGLENVRDVSYLIRVVVRKTQARTFIPPYDAVLPESEDGDEARLVLGSLYPFVCTGSITANEAIQGVNQFMAMMGRSFRLPENAFAPQSGMWTACRRLLSHFVK